MPAIAVDLGVNEAQVIWVVNVYQIAVVAILAGLVALIGIADTTAFGRELTAACRDQAAFGNGMALLSPQLTS